MGEPRSYFLQTARLGFGRWSSADIELANGLWGDPEVAQWIGGPYSAGQIHQKLDGEIASHNAQGIQYWPLFLLADGRHAGCAGLRPYKPEERIYELGFHLRPAYWRQGLAVEAGHKVIEFAFETLEAGALFAGHHPSNPASGAVLLKLGFRFTHDGIYPATGQPDRCYLLSRDEWPGAPLRSSS